MPSSVSVKFRPNMLSRRLKAPTQDGRTDKKPVSQQYNTLLFINTALSAIILTQKYRRIRHHSSL